MSITWNDYLQLELGIEMQKAGNLNYLSKDRKVEGLVSWNQALQELRR